MYMPRSSCLLLSRSHLSFATSVLFNMSADSPATVQALDQAMGASQQLAQELQGGQGRPSMYLPDRGSISQAGASSWSFLPSSTQTLLLQRLQPLPGTADAPAKRADAGGNGSTGVQGAGMTWLMLASVTPRALSRRERLWAAAIAGKLSATLQAPVP